MTRKSLIARENKRMKTVAKYATKRAEPVSYTHLRAHET